MKWKYLLLLLLALIGFAVWLVFGDKTPVAKFVKPNTPPVATQSLQERLVLKADQAVLYCKRNNFNQDVCFLVDMRIASGKKRFFIYDLNKKVIRHAGLVAHGSCNTTFLANSQFSNTPNCGCSSEGRYKVSYKYNGQFGTAYKLHGLDSTNSNAFKRFIVLHAYDCVPDFETHPMPICNSLGCPMVSYKFLDALTAEIQKSRKPILLWVFK